MVHGPQNISAPRVRPQAGPAAAVGEERVARAARRPSSEAGREGVARDRGRATAPGPRRPRRPDRAASEAVLPRPHPRLLPPARSRADGVRLRRARPGPAARERDGRVYAAGPRRVGRAADAARGAVGRIVTPLAVV